jgi:peptide/nickel transport system ATP-binding protein
VVLKPRHPYTRAQMAAIPPLAARAPRLAQIPGAMPRLSAIPTGCAFHPRCGQAFDRCRRQRPERMAVGAGVEAACWLYAEAEAAPPVASSGAPE